jgi:hypothetical protein
MTGVETGYEPRIELENDPQNDKLIRLLFSFKDLRGNGANFLKKHVCPNCDLKDICTQPAKGKHSLTAHITAGELSNLSGTTIAQNIDLLKSTARCNNTYLLRKDIFSHDYFPLG